MRAAALPLGAHADGMEVEVELISGSLWTFADGKIVRVDFYANREELRDAVGWR